MDALKLANPPPPEYVEIIASTETAPTSCMNVSLIISADTGKLAQLRVEARNRVRIERTVAVVGVGLHLEGRELHPNFLRARRAHRPHIARGSGGRGGGLGEDARCPERPSVGSRDTTRSARKQSDLRCSSGFMVKALPAPQRQRPRQRRAMWECRRSKRRQIWSTLTGRGHLNPPTDFNAELAESAETKFVLRALRGLRVKLFRIGSWRGIQVANITAGP